MALDCMQSKLENARLTNIHNLDYVVLLCEDKERMRAFYHEVLAFPIYQDWDGWLEMQVGAVLLTLRRRGRPYDGPKHPHSAGVQLAFRVAPAEVDACHTELLQKGLRYSKHRAAWSMDIAPCSLRIPKGISWRSRQISNAADNRLYGEDRRL